MLLNATIFSTAGERCGLVAIVLIPFLFRMHRVFKVSMQMNINIMSTTVYSADEDKFPLELHIREIIYFCNIIVAFTSKAKLAYPLGIMYKHF